ncbi:MAG: response regulator transcription factor [Clostridiales Family XIII bacterium]|jgi:DNA-binding response OmpR family regulator|nr:response regulator transcription factor [Clostridiales Family XIII bacterium]
MLDGKPCILIVDDEAKITRALRDFFVARGYRVFVAYDGGEALDVFYEHGTKIDLLLLDVMMPVADGFSVLKEIRRDSSVPAIMLTARAEEYDQITGFRHGADDYIPKPFSTSLLLARVEAVLKRAGKDRAGEIEAGPLRISPARRFVSLGEKRIELTPKEFDLLCCLASNRNKALTRERILNEVWGYDFEGDARTVDTHVKQLRGKLKACGEYIKTVHRIGYRFEADT